MIKRESWQLEDQQHKMWAEGLQDEKPTKMEIDIAINEEGYFAYEIDISFDDMLQCWGWIAKISKDEY